MITNTRYRTPSEIWVSVKPCPKYYMGLILQNCLLFTWNSNFTRCPVFLLNLAILDGWIVAGGWVGGMMGWMRWVGIVIELFGTIFQWSRAVCLCVYGWVGVGVCEYACIFLRNRPGREGIWWEFEELVQPREQNIYCQGDENVNMCTMITHQWLTVWSLINHTTSLLCRVSH